MGKARHNALADFGLDLFYNIRLYHNASSKDNAGRIKNMDQGSQAEKDLGDPAIYDCLDFFISNSFKDFSPVSQGRMKGGC